MVNTTSVESGASSPNVVLMWVITATICLYSGLSAPKDDRLMFSNLCGCNAKSLANFSVWKNHCDFSSNSMFTSVCEPVCTTVPIAVFSKHVEWQEVKMVSATMSVLVVVGRLLLLLI